MSLFRETFLSFAQTRLPIQVHFFRLEFIPKEDGSFLFQHENEKHWFYRARLISFDETDGQQSLRDFCEMEIFLDEFTQENQERLMMLLEGWRDAVEVVFLNRTDANEWPMPDELCCKYWKKVYALKRPQSKEEFTEAFLVRSRLGKFLESF